MAEKKKVGSSSSFIDLFGTKEPTPQSSSAGIFASIFPRPTVGDKNSANSEATKNQSWNAKQGTTGMSGGSGSSSIPNKDRNSVFQEEIGQPCHLSSSLYYGGQDVYSQSPTTQVHPTFKKDRREDDQNGNNSESASRGNWWEGSLYY